MFGCCLFVFQGNVKLYLQLIDLACQSTTMDETKLLVLFSEAIDSPLALEHRVAFSQRKLQFLEDFGSSVAG